MYFRLLLTLLLLGIGGAESHSATGPSWVKQSSTVTAKATVCQLAIDEQLQSQEEDNDITHNRVRSLSTRIAGEQSFLPNTDVFTSTFLPQARAPPVR
ncbi:hypothetical protein [Pseudidiomarina insulisalsae]|uniref:hypothetical protein n=1 Tax=Pseudidiomarina insulisalsae TaxID=575789 RepID=UPI000F87964C|nr:hypothetical protein [Pseudidiomarina insulisalsae]